MPRPSHLALHTAPGAPHFRSDEPWESPYCALFSRDFPLSPASSQNKFLSHLIHVIDRIALREDTSPRPMYVGGKWQRIEGSFYFSLRAHWCARLAEHLHNRIRKCALLRMLS